MFAGPVAWTPHAHARVLVDTFGDGDTFQATLLTWLAEQGAFSAAALQAVSNSDLDSALGRGTCRGADMPRRSELG